MKKNEKKMVPILKSAAFVASFFYCLLVPGIDTDRKVFNIFSAPRKSSLCELQNHDSVLIFKNWVKLFNGYCQISANFEVHAKHWIVALEYNEK